MVVARKTKALETTIEPAGVQGGGLTLDLSKGEDRVLFNRALREGWDIPQTLLKSAPATLQAIADDEDEPSRARISAIKVLVAMKAANVDQMKVLTKFEEDPEEHNHLHLHGAELQTMTDDELTEYRKRIRADIARGRTRTGQRRTRKKKSV